MANLSSLCVQWRIHGHGSRGSELRKAISTLDLTLQPKEVGSRQKLINSSVLLKAYIRSGNLDLGKLLHHKLIHSGLPLDSVLLNCLYSKCGDWQSALSIFQGMGDNRDLVSWSALISCFSNNSMHSQALLTFLHMLQFRIFPNEYCFTASIRSSSNAQYFSIGLNSIFTVSMGFFSLGKQLHSWVIRSGLASDVYVDCTLVDMYAKCAADGSVENSRKVFNSMPLHNVMSWTALISGYVQGRKEQEAMELFCNMLHGHVAPNCFTNSSVLRACANLPDFSFGKQLHSQTIKLGLSAINCVGNSLVNMYARSGSTDCARKAFNILFQKNLFSCSAVIDVHAKALDSEESFNHDIENPAVGAGSFTYGCLLSGAACLGTIGRGEQIHALIVKSGFRTDLCINNALISMYSKCGIKEAALQVFNDMGHRNVITWTSIISTLAKHGFATKALELFYEMLEIGVKPNEVTYIAVLSACSHVGLIYEVWKHFNSMHYNYDISPRMEHYACMVDLLGRSRLLVEAIEFITSMPFDADALV